MNIKHRSESNITGTSLPFHCQTERNSGKFLKTTEKT